MASLPVEIKTKDAVRVFERVGFVCQQRRSGSHQTMKRPGTNPISLKHTTMRIGLLRSLIRQAGMTPDEFMKLYEEL